MFWQVSLKTYMLALFNRYAGSQCSLWREAWNQWIPGPWSWGLDWNVGRRGCPVDRCVRFVFLGDEEDPGAVGGGEESPTWVRFISSEARSAEWIRSGVIRLEQKLIISSMTVSLRFFALREVLWSVLLCSVSGFVDLTFSSVQGRVNYISFLRHARFSPNWLI